MIPTSELIETVRIQEKTKLRCYAYLVGRFVNLPSRKALKKAIKAGRLIHLANGEALTELSVMEVGMSIGLLDKPSTFEVWEYPIKVIYEDDEVAVVYKPSGMTTASVKRKCLKHALPFNLRQSQRTDRLSYPVPVHRLDHATKGLLLCAKTASAAVSLGKQFEERCIQKQYVAIVHGRYSGSRCLDTPIDGKAAITRVVETAPFMGKDGAWYTRMVLEPHHGRTHQIRIHLSGTGHPIVGDRFYGGKPEGHLKLSSVYIAFLHPKHCGFVAVGVL